MPNFLALQVKKSRELPQYFRYLNIIQQALLSNEGICKRGSDGFIHFLKKDISQKKRMQKNRELGGEWKKDGYTDKAVDVLKLAGYSVWKNSVGDIAIKPHENF